ncbi:hypothetical protein [Krasilnikovia sp. MM14-A1259]|uniref:hypothetical protein n=1 Tax=Krasilnikovia sp. MM14-A1259 TaxID=3373539 RepID=UPI00399C8CA4
MTASYMRRVLDPAENPIAVVGELMGALTEPPYRDDLPGAGELYRVWADLSGIVDGRPVDYGDESEVIAVRECRQAAQDWLAMPRTIGGLRR